MVSSGSESLGRKWGLYEMSAGGALAFSSAQTLRRLDFSRWAEDRGRVPGAALGEISSVSCCDWLFFMGVEQMKADES